MSNNKYLNEEKYQKTKNKITLIATLVLVMGILIGGGLIATGIIKNNQLKLSEEEINQINTEIKNYNSELSLLKYQQNQEFIDNGFSEDYYNIKNRIDEIEEKIDELEDKLEPDTFDLPMYYVAGGIVIVMSIGLSSVCYREANGREITSFYAQQLIPVAKEGIDEMAPTIGNAAKEIAKGIKEGVKDEDDK